MMRVLVCGGRDYNDRATVFKTLDEIEPDAIIQGQANGADALARDWWGQRPISCPGGLFCYPADWKTHGKAAGPIRNQKMIDEGKPDLVLAFPGGRGTADMVRRAKAAGVTVKEIS